MARIILEPGEQFTFDSNLAGIINGYAASAEDVTVTDNSTLQFDATFNGGGDTIRFTGAATNFTISRDGATAILTSAIDNISVRIPIGEDTNLVFENGITLVLGTNNNGQPVIGDQVILLTPAPVQSSGSGSVVNLTVDVDIVSGEVFNSQPAFTPGGDDFINTLQDEDVLTGIGAYNVLNATIGGTSEEGTEDEIAPTLNNVQEANFSITDDDVSVIDFQDATGLEELNLVRLTDTGATITFDNLDATVTRLGVDGATNDGAVAFDYSEDTLDGEDDEVTLTLDDARLASLAIGETSDSSDDDGFGFETVNVDVVGDANIDSLFIGANDEEGDPDDFDDVRQLIDIDVTDGSSLEVNDFFAEGVDDLTIDAQGEVIFAADEDDVLSSSNDAMSTFDLENLTITGDSDVTLDGIDGDAGDYEDGQGVTIDASAATGDIRLGVSSDASDDADFVATTGTGNDEILIYGNLGGDVATGAGNDSVSTDIDFGQYRYNVDGHASIDTGAGNDTVAVGNLVGHGDNLGGFADNHTDEDQAPTITTGAGDDSITVGFLGNAIDYDDGANDDLNDDDSYEIVGAVVDAGAGNDDIEAYKLREGAILNAGAGDDDVVINMTSLGGISTIVGGDTDSQEGDVAPFEVNSAGNEDLLGAQLLLGDGNDDLLFTDVGLDVPFGTGNSYTIVGAGGANAGGLIDGGAGSNTFSVEVVDNVTVAEASTNNAANDDKVLIDNFQVIDVTIEAQITAGEAADTGLAQTDNESNEVTVNIDVARISTDLTTLNLTSNERPLLTTLPTEDWIEGGEVNFDLDNLRSGIDVNLVAHEASGVNGSGELEDDTNTDVQLFVNMAVADADDQNTTFTLDINQGVQALGNFDIDIEAQSSANIGTFNPATSTTDDNDLLIENIVINLNDNNSHEFEMSGFGDGQHTDARNLATLAQVINFDPINNTANEFDDLTAAELLEVSTGGDGGINVDGVGGDDLFYAGAGLGQGNAANTSLTINGTKDGTTIDVVDVTADVIAINGAADVNLDVDIENNYTITTGSGEDVVDLRDDNVDNEDTINLGAGTTDRIIIDGNDSIGYSVPPSAQENDDAWENKLGIEELEIEANNGVNTIVLDEQAQAAGLQRIYFTSDGGVNTQVTTLVIGDDFEPTQPLIIDGLGDQDLGNFELTLISYEDDTTMDVDLRVDADDGFTLNFTDDDERIDLDVTIDVDNGAPTTEIGSAANGVFGNADEVSLNVTTGNLQSIILIDDADVAGEPTPGVDLTVDDAWSDDELLINAAAITNDDNNLATGGLDLDGSDELDADLTVTGTANNDLLVGGAGDDILSGNAGNDVIIGDGVQTVQDTLVVEEDAFRVGDELFLNTTAYDLYYTVGNNVVGMDFNGDGIVDENQFVGAIGTSTSAILEALESAADHAELFHGFGDMDIEANGDTITLTQTDEDAANNPEDIVGLTLTPAPAQQQTATVTVTNISVVEPLALGTGYTVTLDGPNFFAPLVFTATSDGTDTIDDLLLSIANQVDAFVDLSGTYNAGTNTITIAGVSPFDVGPFTVDATSSASGTQFIDEQITVPYVPESTLNTDLGNNAEVTGAGDDTLNGGDGADDLFGGDGDDTLNGDAGDDELTGGLGADTLNGGAGDDIIYYEDAAESTGLTVDEIIGFQAGSGNDVLNFSGLGLGAIDFEGTFASAATANTQLDAGGDVEAVFVTATNTLYVDVNNNGDIDTADMAIDFTGLTGTLVQQNFV